MGKNLTEGNVSKTMLLFSGPMILGNLLQQCYNIVDTIIVGQVLGAEALAAVGAAYTLMTFLTSILIGMCMGSGTLFSFYYGKRDYERLKDGIVASFLLVGGISVLMNILVFVKIDFIFRFLNIPDSLMGMMHDYVWSIFWGIFFVFLYNYYAFLLRAVGDSVTPLWFLGISSVLNVLLDVIFVMKLHWGIEGAAFATVFSQIAAGIGIAIYTWWKEPGLRISIQRARQSMGRMPEMARYSFASSIQQSVMNFGILLIQGLVNSFGTIVMAAFAAAVKIDSFAYMPAQEFSNAFSIFISQNHGAGKEDRVKKGVRSAVMISVLFCIIVSVMVFIFAAYLMMIFISPQEKEIIQVGVGYLRVEGSFYCGIGILFLLYGYYRSIGKPEMSVVLTVISLGTRVVLAYILAPIPEIGVWGIWWAIPIGWLLADVTGFIVMRKIKRSVRIG